MGWKFKLDKDTGKVVEEQSKIMLKPKQAQLSPVKEDTEDNDRKPSDTKIVDRSSKSSLFLPESRNVATYDIDDEKNPVPLPTLGPVTPSVSPQPKGVFKDKHKQKAVQIKSPFEPAISNKGKPTSTSESANIGIDCEPRNTGVKCDPGTSSEQKGPSSAEESNISSSSDSESRKSKRVLRNV